MRVLFLFLLLFFCTTTFAQVSKDSSNVYLFSAVKQPCTYLKSIEKEIIQQLNIARMYPLWYVYFYLQHPTTENQKSLKETLLKMQATTEPLIPDMELSESEKCHALSGGTAGIESHDRINKKCKSMFSGECIDFGVHQAKDIVLHLLIDEGVPSLGHRNIILNTNYRIVGLSFQPHKTYGVHAVIGFK